MKKLPPENFLIGKSLPGFKNHVIDRRIGSGANGHVFLGHDHSTRSSLAFKVILVDSLSKSEASALEEARRANQIDHSSVVKCITAFPYSEGQIKTLIFVYNYVNGDNLRDYVRKNSDDINVSFVKYFLKIMFELLYELQGRGFPHGDLHARNILVAKSDFDLDDGVNLRVTDFGVQQFSEQPDDRSDYLLVAETLKLLLEQVKYEDCDGRDRFLFDAIRNDFLRRHLIETDTSADSYARDPQKMRKKLADLEDEYNRHQNTYEDSSTPQLITPFDYPNCEQIGDAHLLLKNLYSDRLLGLSEIDARSNLVLTGPRGCGKTTVFRALSLHYLASVDNDNPDTIRYVGIYYRCDDLYFSFPRYKLPEYAEALDVPMHFLIVTLLASMLEQLSVWAQKHFLEEFKRKEKMLTSELWNILGMGRPNAPNVDRVETLVNKLHKERKRAANQPRCAHAPTESIESYLQPGLMVEACEYIRNSFSFLKDRPFYFFIDDYSAPKITMDLQKNINRLVMFRSPYIFFKLSTESPVSFAREDIDNKKFVETREYDLVNLGLRYLTNESDQGRQFLEDMFRRRFNEVEGYPVNTLEDLLGTFPRNENETARDFRKSKKKELKYYAGCETLAAMCSGDIHYMIRLVANMVEDVGGRNSLATSQDVPKISPKQQNKTIHKAAGGFMETIRTFPDKGPHLADVITAFGKVAHSYLLHENSANERGHPPHQASRIEPYKALQLSDQARNVLDELLRYSILIEDPRGRSRRGNIVPRYYLRRYLIPHFRLTFSRRDSLQLENHEIEALLCNPSEFEKRHRRLDPDQTSFLEDE